MPFFLQQALCCSVCSNLNLGGALLILCKVGTSFTTAYQSIREMNVTAGLGQFNGSLVEPYLQQVNYQVPYFALASTDNFIKNPMFSVALDQTSVKTQHATSIFFPEVPISCIHKPT